MIRRSPSSSQCRDGEAARHTTLAIPRELGASISRPSSAPTPRVAFAKLYDRKRPIAAADLLNDRGLPFFDEHDVGPHALRPVAPAPRAAKPPPRRRAA